MKTINYRKTLYSLLATSLITCLLLTACYKDDDDISDNDMFTISGAASGSQEIPSNTTTGSAALSGSYNARTNLLSYTINWTGLTGSLTAAHFHGPASTTESASPILDIMINMNGVTGSTSATATVTDAFESALLSGKIYYNLHTALYPNGEVRSQVATQGSVNTGGGGSGGGGY